MQLYPHFLIPFICQNTAACILRQYWQWYNLCCNLISSINNTHQGLWQPKKCYHIFLKKNTHNEKKSTHNKLFNISSSVFFHIYKLLDDITWDKEAWAHLYLNIDLWKMFTSNEIITWSYIVFKKNMLKGIPCMICYIFEILVLAKRRFNYFKKVQICYHFIYFYFSLLPFNIYII